MVVPSKLAFDGSSGTLMPAPTPADPTFQTLLLVTPVSRRELVATKVSERSASSVRLLVNKSPVVMDTSPPTGPKGEAWAVNNKFVRVVVSAWSVKEPVPLENTPLLVKFPA